MYEHDLFDCYAFRGELLRVTSKDLYWHLSRVLHIKSIFHHNCFSPFTYKESHRLLRVTSPLLLWHLWNWLSHCNILLVVLLSINRWNNMLYIVWKLKNHSFKWCIAHSIYRNRLLLTSNCFRGYLIFLKLIVNIGSTMRKNNNSPMWMTKGHAE